MLLFKIILKKKKKKVSINGLIIYKNAISQLLFSNNQYITTVYQIYENKNIDCNANNDIESYIMYASIDFAFIYFYFVLSIT